MQGKAAPSASLSYIARLGVAVLSCVAFLNVLWASSLIWADTHAHDFLLRPRTRFRDDQGTAFARLVSWLKGTCGAHVGPVTVGKFRGIRGLGAEAALKEGDVLMRIPRRCILDEDQQVFEHGPMAAVDPGHRLGFYIAEQRRLGEKSRWAPYLAIMPSFEQFSQFLPFARVAMARRPSGGRAHNITNFTGLPVIEEAMADEAAWWDTFMRFKQAHEADSSSPAPLSWHDVAWGHSVVSTRACTIADLPGGRGLVPIFDMMNTWATPDGGGGEHSVVWHQHLEDGFFVMRAAEPLFHGSELTSRYFYHVEEKRSLTNYGFRGGAGSWRDLSEGPDERCDGWLRSASDVLAPEAVWSTPLERDLAAMAQKHCAGTLRILAGKAWEHLATYMVWIRAFLRGDFRILNHGIYGGGD